MGKVLGVDVLVSVGGTVIGSQSNGSLKIDSKEIDVSDKTTGGFDTFLAGNRTWSIDCEAITLDSDAGQDALEAAALAGTTVTGSIVIGSRGTYTGSAMVNNFELTGEKDDKSTCKCTLKGASALVKS